MSDRTPPAFDPTAIIAVLADHEVRFVAVGGYAAGVQGAMYVTNDLDVCYARTRENHDRLARALADLEAEPRDLPEGVRVHLDARALAAGTTWTLMTKFGQLDLLAEPGPGISFDVLAPRARTIRGDRTYLVATVADLIAMKTAAGRPKDLAQIELLRATQEELSDRNPDDL